LVNKVAFKKAGGLKSIFLNSLEKGWGIKLARANYCQSPLNVASKVLMSIETVRAKK
jgi:hypothetical protein